MIKITPYKFKYMFAIALFTIIGITNIQARQYIRIIEATSMKWSGGVRSGPSGITYCIKAVILTKQRIDFKDLSIGKDRISPESVSNADRVTVKHHKGDTITIVYTLHHETLYSQMDTLKTSANSSPIHKNKGAVIYYTVGKAIKYESIEFRVLPPQNRQ